MDWYTLVLISSLIMGTATILEKHTLKAEHATAFSAVVTPLVALLSLVFIPLANFQLSVLQWVVMIGLGVLNAYGYLLAARVYKHGQMSVTSSLTSSLPVLFTIVLALLFLGEVLSIFQYFVILGMVVATYFLLFRKQRGGSPAFDGGKYAYELLLYSLVSAVGTITSRYLLIGMDPFTFLILSGITMSVSFTILITWRYGGVSEIIDSVKRYKLPLAAQAILTLGYRVPYYIALTITPASLAMPFRNTFYVVVTVLLGGSLFKESGLARKLTLALLLVLFGYLLTLNA